ncbi:LOW QUALITY PROTEIN: uncharacterized protein LOC108900901 [Lates calcarifer]|uniref:LOW QUALITY PROTEIN: uncharacterized protein LOC108900901 n=1 Tax=Lates calcarifer TaxID=8187 RepID=A0AAJ8AVJ5_LATCA|nr:LOW QUALITY PROTEIN: uncharacterized protein LOC108900901 [Lates calcarifer]
MMTMVFAVEEINRDSRLLPGVKLGYRIMDSCDHVHTSMQALFSLIIENATEDRMERSAQSDILPSCLAGSPVSAVIGLASSSPTRAVAHTLGPFNIPLVSYFATCTCLTDKHTYPSFLRTVPSDLFQVKGLVQLVTFLGWLWVGTIGTTDDYSHYGIQAFSSQFRQQGGCVAFHLTIPKSPTAAEIQEMADRLQSSTTQVVVVFATEGQLLDLLLEGTLGFAFPGVRIPGLKEFLLNVRPSPTPGMEFVNMFWEELFGCRLQFGGDRSKENAADIPVCTGSEDLSNTESSYTDVSQARISYNVYKAVYAIAHALHTLLNCDSAELNMGMCEKHKSFTSRQLLDHLKTVNFTNQFEEKVYFDSNGEPVPLYDIINWQKNSKGEIRFIKVGSYDGSTPLGQQLQLEQSTIVWTKGQSQVPVSQCSAPCPSGTRQARRPGEPQCCFDCLPCADGEISNQTGSTECTKCPEFYWSDKDKVNCIAGIEEFLSFYDTMGIVLVVLTLLGVVLTTIITTVFHRFRSTPIVKANNSEISFLLLLSLKLCFLCSLLFIGQPSVWTCRLRQAAFGISFVLCLSCLLVKTIVVLLAFQANIPGTRALKLFGPSQQRSLILAATAPQVCLCAGWLLAAPPFPFKNPTYQASTGKIVVECKEPWPPGFYLVLGYIGLLAFLCLLLAFLGRKLPDAFNEAKLITFSMLIFWAVWISFIPAYVSSPGKFTVAVEIFAILASSFGLLLCIFVPKCYIILLRPERNIKKGLVAVKAANTTRVFPRMQEMQSENVMLKAVWRSMQDQDVGFPMKTREHRKHRVSANRMKKLSSEIFDITELEFSFKPRPNMALWAAKLIMFLSLFRGTLGSAALDSCVFLGEEEKNSLYEDGDVVIGGLFPLHYSPESSLPTYKTKPTLTMYNFKSRALRWIQTMTFAIKEINQRSDLLPQLKLGYHIRDSCDDIPVALRELLLLVNGQPERGSGADSIKKDKDLERNNGSSLGCAAVHRTVSPVIVGDASSGSSVALLRSLGSFHIPLVSYFASCSCLSDQREFPTFMRTMPSDAFQIRALVQLVTYFGWTWVGVIGVDSDYARFAIQLFLQESVQYGVCAAYTHLYPVTLSQQALDKLLECYSGTSMASSKVIINFCSESEMQGILTEIRRRNITGLQWIASEAWATATLLWEKFGNLLTGTLGFAIQRADVIPGLEEHLTSVRPSDIHKSTFLAEFWEETFNCRLNGSVNSHFHGVGNYLDRLPCKGTESLDDVYSPYSDVTQLRVSYNIYKAVYLVAHALQDMSDCKGGKGPFSNGTCADPKHFKPWQLIHYMRRANFSAQGAKVNFDQNGDPIAYYDLLNWQRSPDGSLHLVKVGFYDASSPAGYSLVINDSVIQWPVGKQASRSVCSDSCPPGSRVARRKGEPICCFDCVPCAEGEVSNETDSLECTRCSEDTWPNRARDLCIPKTIEYLSYHELMGIMLCVVSVLGACISLSILAIFFMYKDTPLVRANNMELSFLLLVFLAVCFLVGLLFIGEPSDWLCRIRYPTFGISVALCISCLLAKTAVVLMAFRSTLPGSNMMKWFGPNQQRASVLFGTAVQVIICLIWLLTSPPHANSNTDYHSATIIMECVTGSEVCFWCVLGYIGILACMCFLMAFLARKLPDNFNEAKFITFSMLIFFAVWITFIPVYVSTAGKYTVAVHIFAILASAFGLLFCIFAPKCYIIILKPEKNSKKHMMQR